jgi:vacuolar-type H+-ATPase subunit E/Vma4
MAIEDIFRALEEQADAECTEILRVAEAQASSVRDEARREADRTKAQKLAAVEEVVVSRVGKTINAARLENRKALAAVRDSAVENAFSGALEKLGAMRGKADYESVFRALAEETLTGVTGECDVLVDPADVALAEKVVKAINSSCVVKPEISTTGGLIAVTVGGRVTRRNTFESRLEKAHSLAQAQVAEILTK